VIAVDRIGNHWTHGPLGSREATVHVVGPLHRRPRAFALRKCEVITHADLITILKHRCPGQREQQAECQFEFAAIIVEHRGQPPADAALIELRVGRRAERVEHTSALRIGEAAEVQLVVTA
jgi:hypothetical protein